MMGIYLCNVSIVIYVFALVACGDQLDKLQTGQCHDRNKNCLTDQKKREPSDAVLRLPRINAVKVGKIYFSLPFGRVRNWTYHFA